MREYGKIATRIWTDPKVISRSGDAKLVFLYLLAGAETNAIGCFRCTPLNIAASEVCSVDQAAAALVELSDSHLIKYDTQAKIVLLPNWFRYNPICNKFAGKAAAKALSQLQETPLVDYVIELMSEFEKFLPDGWRDTSAHKSRHMYRHKCRASDSDSDSEREREREGDSDACAREAGDNSTPADPAQHEDPPPCGHAAQDSEESPPATAKQIQFVERLLRENGMTLQDWATKHRVDRILDQHITEIRAEYAGPPGRRPVDGPRPYLVDQFPDDPDLTEEERQLAEKALEEAKQNAGMQ